MSLDDHLQEIYESEGVLTPQNVEMAAQPVDHPLHPRFEWDPIIGAYKYRLVQAGELIRSVKITYRETESETKSVRKWVAPMAPERPNEYMPMTSLAVDPVRLNLVRDQMRRDWLAFKAKYESFEEFWGLVRSDIPN